MNKILSAIYVFLVTVSAVNGDTPHELAVQKDDIETVKILINSGADIHVTDEYGDTLLDRSLFADRIEIAELLKSKGAKAPNYEEAQIGMSGNIHLLEWICPIAFLTFFFIGAPFAFIKFVGFDESSRRSSSDSGCGSSCGSSCGGCGGCGGGG